jgi:hypothetical protein
VNKPSYYDTRILWTGTVSSVSKEGQVLVSVSTDARGFWVMVDLGQLPRETYLALNKNQRVTFESTITRIEGGIGTKYIRMTNTVLR